MAGIVQGIAAGVDPSPQLGLQQIPVEATAQRELKVTSPVGLNVEQRIEQVMMACLNELVILNNRMWRNAGEVVAESERVGIAYALLYDYQNRK